VSSVAPDLALIVRLMADDLTSPRRRPVARRLAQVVRLLERERARYAIVGAVAMGAHGVRRFTEDIDVMVDGQHMERVLAAAERGFKEIGREPASGPPFQVKLRSRRARGPEGVDVDLMSPLDVIEQWALETATRARAAGRKVDVASPEALVVLKLRAYVSDRESEEGGRHRVDAMRLVRSLGVDVSALRRFLSRSPELLAELERILAAPAPRGRRPG
jgi:hypothetical protein